MKYSKWQLLLIVLFLCLGAAGAALSVKPLVFRMEKGYEIKKEVHQYKVALETVQKVSEEKQEPIPFEQLFNDIRHYNISLFTCKQNGLSSKSAYEQSPLTLTEYGFPNEKFGIITIPKIDLEMPLFLGASEENMAAGAAVLSQTSIPIGGDSTNAVIAGHRGWNGYPYFLDIEKLEVGDQIHIINVWGKLVYEVSEIKIVNPNDVSAILIQPGRDLITLLTCHPPNTGGRYRYLVYCERVDTNAVIGTEHYN